MSDVRDFDPLEAARLGTPVSVSPALPIVPGYLEDTKRFVRHAYADAGYWAESLGDVGPRPGEQIRALWTVTGLVVDQALFDELRLERERRSLRFLYQARERRRWQAIQDAVTTCLNVVFAGRPVTHVQSYVEDTRLGETTWRAHLIGTELVRDAGATYVMRDEDIRRAIDRGGDSELVKVVTAHLERALRPLLVALKIDEEEAGRAGS